MRPAIRGVSLWTDSIHYIDLPGKKVAVVGPNADATLTLLSNYHGSNTLVNNHSVLAAMQVCCGKQFVPAVGLGPLVVYSGVIV